MTNGEAIKDYIVYLISWLTGHCDLELDSQTEFEMIRVIMDSFDIYVREHEKRLEQND